MTRKITTAPKALISAAQDLTGAWVDLGGVIPTSNAEAIGLYLTLDINGSTNARVRMLTLHTSGGTEHVLPIRTVGASAVAVEDEYIEFTDDADQSMLLSWTLAGIIPFVQFQVSTGAVGAPAGQIDAANIVIAE